MALLSDLTSGIAIPRNPLYRKREVRLLLNTGTVIGGGQKANAEVATRQIELVLTEVTAISQNSAGASPILPGAIVATIQPWYFLPMEVEISGRSYMGAYANSKLNIASDNDVTKLMTLRQYVNEAFSLAQSSLQGLQATLTIGDPQRNVLGTDQQLVGFVSNLSIDESTDDQYVMRYRFRFTGELSAVANLQTGEQRARVDKQNASDIKTSGISASVNPNYITKTFNVGAGSPEVVQLFHPTP